MAKTTNINLNLTEYENTSFVDWRKSIDGNNDSENKSNMQIIDEKIGDHETRITALENAGGSGGKLYFHKIYLKWTEHGYVYDCYFTFKTADIPEKLTASNIKNYHFNNLNKVICEVASGHFMRTYDGNKVTGSIIGIRNNILSDILLYAGYEENGTYYWNSGLYIPDNPTTFIDDMIEL